jgi:hypothetical protein
MQRDTLLCERRRRTLIVPYTVPERGADALRIPVRSCRSLILDSHSMITAGEPVSFMHSFDRTAGDVFLTR